MDTVNNEIFVRRARKVHLPVQTNAGKKPTAGQLTALQRNIEPYGFILSADLLGSLRGSILASSAELAKELNVILPKIKGAHVAHKPMYPNFPQQVAEASVAELYLNAFMHYFGDVAGLRIMPKYEKETRPALDVDFSKFIVLEQGTAEEFAAILPNLLSSKLSISAGDAEDVKFFFDNLSTDELHAAIPAEIPNKENLALAASLSFDKDRDLFNAVLSKAATATDILRIAAHLSGAGATLAPQTPIRFRNFPRSVRKAFLLALDSMHNPVEDMIRNVALWKLLGEKLHPGEFANRFPKAHEAFRTLRNNVTVETFAHKVEEAIKDARYGDAVDLLAERPGELARRLDHLLRVSFDRDAICDMFNDVAPSVSTPVLWQVKNHFLNRNEAAKRVFAPKGGATKLFVTENALAPLSDSVCAEIVASCNRAIQLNYADKEHLGRVFIDPALKNFTIPSAVRSASKTLNTAGRGTRTSLNPADQYQRLFLWWKDGVQRTDIDLSAVMLDKDFKTVADVSYGNLRYLGAVHSGDITSAPNGASEFIDVPLEQLKKHSIRYVAMLVNSFTEQPFADLPECFAGVMGLKDGRRGEIFDARAVDNIFDVAAASKVVIPLVIDVEKAESVWADLSMSNYSGFANNVWNNSETIAMMVQAVLDTKRPSLYDLFNAHAKARALEVVEDRTVADTVFHADNGRVSESMESILSDWL